MFIEFTLSAILEAGTGGGVGFFKLASSWWCWSVVAGAVLVSDFIRSGPTPAPSHLSRMPNRDLSRASTLSRFDTAEPVEVADWGGCARRPM